LADNNWDPRRRGRSVYRSLIQQVLVTATFGSLLSAVALAQQGQPTELPEAPAPVKQPQSASNPIGSSVERFLTLQKKSLVFPDLATTEGPLDPWQKLKLAANNSVSLSTVGAALIGAGFNQAINSPSGYGQEWGGYGKRFGAGMGRVASANFFGTFLISSVDHEDPRFYVKKDLNFQQSVEYAAVRLAVTRKDSGEPTVNYSGLVGSLAAEALADTYYPQGNRSFGSVMIRYASDQGWRFAGHLLRQYWPEINKRLTVKSEDLPSSPPNP
jgi:hypothetical protein